MIDNKTAAHFLFMASVFAGYLNDTTCQALEFELNIEIWFPEVQNIKDLTTGACKGPHRIFVLSIFAFRRLELPCWEDCGIELLLKVSRKFSGRKEIDIPCTLARLPLESQSSMDCHLAAASSSLLKQHSQTSHCVDCGPFLT